MRSLLRNARSVRLMTSPFKQHPPLKLLVSVRNAAEAEAALAGGADWIDLKEPSRGALGAVAAAVAREVVSCVAGRAPVSAAVGELLDWETGQSRELLAIDGLSVIKLGLAGCRGRSWQSQWQNVRAEIQSAGKELAAVIYADDVAATSPTRSEILQVANESSCRWVLIDTYDKDAGSIVSALSNLELKILLSAAQVGDRTVVAAGRLQLETIASLPLEFVNIIGVRGAACDGGRGGAVCRQRVAALRRLLDMAPLT
jgi:(5-formylfuran-3-yl)methyl phosphate synthase